METSDLQFTGMITCGHCGNKAPMRVVTSYSQVQDYEDERSGIRWEAGPIWNLLLCPACNGVTLQKIDWHSCYEDSSDVEQLYPSGTRPLVGLPPDVDSAYQAALRIRYLDTNAFAVLLGRVLDKVCLNRGVHGKSLYERLVSLAQKGEIPERLAEMANQLRQLRNIGAHADLGDLTPAEVPILDDLCRTILEYVYTAPQMITQVERRIDELKQRSKEGGGPEGASS